MKSILLILLVILCGFQILLCGIGVFFGFGGMLQNPSILFSFDFLFLILGAYGLVSLILMVCNIEDYSATKIPLYISIGLFSGTIISIYLTIDLFIKNRTDFMGLLFPLAPLALLFICLFVIYRLRKTSRNKIKT